MPDKLISLGKAHCLVHELKFVMVIKKQIILYHVSSQIFNEYLLGMFTCAGNLMNFEFLERCDNNWLNKPSVLIKCFIGFIILE